MSQARCFIYNMTQNKMDFESFTLEEINTKNFYTNIIKTTQWTQGDKLFIINMNNNIIKALN